MHLLDGLLRFYRTVVADHFLTSISLAERLLEHDTYVIGARRSTRIRSGNELLLKKLRRGEVDGLQWKDGRDVLMISARPLHSATVVNTGKTNSKNERIMKPQVVLD
jgi:hypothetical protein